MTKIVAALDVHKRVLMVVVFGNGEVTARKRFMTGTWERRNLVDWLKKLNVEEVVMESTAQYWKPIWLDLEAQFEGDKLHL